MEEDRLAALVLVTTAASYCPDPDEKPQPLQLFLFYFIFFYLSIDSQILEWASSKILEEKGCFSLRL